MKSVRLVQIFCPAKETNRTHSKGYVEDLSTQAGRKQMHQDGSAEFISDSLSLSGNVKSGESCTSCEQVFHHHINVGVAFA